MTVYRNMIVPAKHVILARLLAAIVAPDSGRDMWIAGLSPNGQMPATHYFSEGLIDDEFAALLDQPDSIVSICASLEPPVIVDINDVSALLANADISEEFPDIAFARLGLRVIPWEECGL